MDDFNPELYRRLSDFIERGCKQQNIEKNYVEYLFSMEQAESIEKLVKIYNNIFKLLAVIYYGGRNVPYNWYIYERWENEPREMVEELNQYFNDNILRWFKRQGYPSKEKCALCIINLRECKKDGYIAYIERKIMNVANGNTPKDIYTLAHWRVRYHEQIKEINRLGKADNTYGANIHYFKCFSKLLAANKHVFDVIEESFAQQHKVNYTELLVQYQKEQEERETRIKVLKEEKEREERERMMSINNALMDRAGSAVGSFLLNLPFAFIGGILGAAKKGKR